MTYDFSYDLQVFSYDKFFVCFCCCFNTSSSVCHHMTSTREEEIRTVDSEVRMHSFKFRLEHLTVTRVWANSLIPQYSCLQNGDFNDK